MRNYRRSVIWLITISASINILFSLTTELGNVEVYYWSWSLYPKLNYVDHPPVVAWMISATTLGQTFVNEGTVRLGAVISAAIATWLSFQIGEQLRDQRTGWYAALCYSSCVFSTVVAGKHILPDSPQMVCWMASLLLALKLFSLPGQDIRSRKYWLLLGFFAGLCILCKIHGACIWAGVVLYCMLYDRNRFRDLHFYLSLLVTCVIISPIIIWNLQHDWYTFRFQGQRFFITGASIDMRRFLSQSTGVFFAVGPIHFFLVWRCVFRVIRKRISAPGVAVKLLLCCNLPLILFLIVISLFREVHDHWPGPAYAGLLALVACDLAADVRNVSRNFPWIFKAALAYCLLIMLLESLVINYYPGTIAAEKDGVSIGRGDATVDMVGWKETQTGYLHFYNQAVHDKILDPATTIIASSWTPAAALDFYLAKKTKQQVLGIGSLDSLHEYYYMNQYKRPLRRGDDALYIVPSNYADTLLMEKVSAHFSSATNVLTIPIYRSEILCKQTYVFLLKQYDGIPFHLE